MAVATTTCHVHATTDVQAEVPNPRLCVVPQGHVALRFRGAKRSAPQASRSAVAEGSRRDLRAPPPHRFQSAGTAERGVLTVPADWPDTKDRPATARP